MNSTSKLGRTGIVVASRFDSSRLPGKAMFNFAGHSLIGFVLSRLKTSLLSDVLILATSDQVIDDVVASEAKKYGVKVYRGSLNDVLGRYSGAAREFQLDTVIRLTGDNPFVNGEYVDNFSKQIVGVTDTIYTTRPLCPRGLNVQILSADMLFWLDKKNDLSHAHREHVTSWFYTNKSPWNPVEFSLPNGWKEIETSFSIDTIDDYKKAVKFIDSVDYTNFSTEDFVDGIMSQK